MLICIRDCAQKVHTVGNRHQKLRTVYIDIITTNLWTASLLAGEQGGSESDENARAFLELDYIDKLLEIVEILGEEVFEEFFDDLAMMYTYTFNAMIFGRAEDSYNEQKMAYECFKNAMPFLVDILAHVIIHNDDTEESARDSLNWTEVSLRDPFNFESAIDFNEALQTMELFLAMGEGVAHQ